MIVRAFNRNRLTCVGNWAPGIPILEGYAISAFIVGGAAGRDLNAGPLGRAPSIPGRPAYTLTAVVVVIGAFSGNRGTLFCGRTPGVSSADSQALAAVIVGGAALWDLNTCFGGGAPAEADRADTDAAVVVVSRALGGNYLALVAGRAPRVSGFEAQAVAAVVIGVATLGDSGALFLV